ncbi:hypothetical protein MKW94_014934 [Papaver nudicaule]|uniref:Cytochrome b5 heme-binding domain-containing protein n=1 Tax=Papaver nudicaule TaxID=74823 RepID=A0AA41V9W2_PAPNU|nr:hypothetical protein [Papaver nudicaule]
MVGSSYYLLMTYPSYSQTLETAVKSINILCCNDVVTFRSYATYIQESKLYTRAEIALHNKRTDCWIIIKNKVFDVTPYVEEHPGGDAILVHAGDDSTEGFYGPQHGTRVFDLIDDFCIGELQL